MTSPSVDQQPFLSEYLVKILILGDSNVGKSCLLLRYINESCPSQFVPTIGVDFVNSKQKTRTLQIEDSTLKLQIWDTAGQERFRNITSYYYRNAQGILLVFDLSSRESFQSLDFWLNQVEKQGGDRFQVVLVGNKTDLERKISQSQAEAFAMRHRKQYVETSINDQDKIEEAFRILAESTLRNRRQSVRTGVAVQRESEKFKCCVS